MLFKLVNLGHCLSVGTGLLLAMRPSHDVETIGTRHGYGKDTICHDTSPIFEVFVHHRLPDT